jgi:hypothetical protein
MTREGDSNSAYKFTFFSGVAALPYFYRLQRPDFGYRPTGSEFNKKNPIPVFGDYTTSQKKGGR